jgi:hypothetical protein
LPSAWWDEDDRDIATALTLLADEREKIDKGGRQGRPDPEGRVMGG